MRSLVVVALLAIAAGANAMPQWWAATGQTKVSNDYIVAGTCPQTMNVVCNTQFGLGCCPTGSICGNGLNNCQKGYCCAAGGATCDTTQCVGSSSASWCTQQFVCPFGQICCSAGSTCFTWGDGSVGCRVACFSGDSFVTVEGNQKKLLSEVKIGDRVLALNTKTNKMEYSDVYAFLDVDRTSSMEFVNIATSNGEISITAEHLIMSKRDGTAVFEAIAARRVLVGDLLQLANGEVVKIEKISSVFKVGAYAPATVLGTVVINDVVASCYAYTSHFKAHAAMAPLRWLWETTPSVLIEETPKEGVHWYSGFLMKRFQGLLDVAL